MDIFRNVQNGIEGGLFFREFVCHGFCSICGCNKLESIAYKSIAVVFYITTPNPTEENG